MGSRHASREMALQYLFGSEFRSEAGTGVSGDRTNLSPRQWIEQYGRDFKEQEETSDFAIELSHGVEAHKAEIDRIIQSHSAHWKLSRMSLVDLNILRLAVYEMHFSPKAQAFKVVINEAVELAKRFGTSESGSFVNGVLDQIAKSLMK